MSRPLYVYEVVVHERPEGVPAVWLEEHAVGDGLDDGQRFTWPVRRHWLSPQGAYRRAELLTRWGCRVEVRVSSAVTFEQHFAGLELGHRVSFTHLATGAQRTSGGYLKVNDVPAAELRRYRRRGSHVLYPTEQPMRDGEKLDRWVVCWPYRGEATVVGVTYRNDGIRIPGYQSRFGYGGEPEFEAGELRVKRRHKLIQVKHSLRSATLLVPPFAIVDELDWDAALEAEPVPDLGAVT